MKNLKSLFDKGMEIVKDAVGSEYMNPIVEVKINTRAKKRWGLCRKKDGSVYEIEISDMILKDEVPDNATLSTIVHEILHSCKKGSGHGERWKWYADKVMKKYPELKITRTSSAEFFGLQDDERIKSTATYGVACENCGYKVYRSRITKVISHPERYRCPYCGGKIKRFETEYIRELQKSF